MFGSTIKMRLMSSEYLCLFTVGGGYFDMDGILPLEAILPQSFMCVYTAVVATILQVTLWHLDSAPVLKCNGYGL